MWGEKYVFKKEFKLLQSENKEAKKQRDKQEIYVFKGEHRLEEQD